MQHLKRASILFSLLSVILILNGCFTKTDRSIITKQSILVSPKGTTTQIYGIIKNSREKQLSLFNPEYKDTAVINNGAFQFEFNLTKPAYFYLNTHKKSLQLFLVPGDSFTVKFDVFDIFNSVTFSGKGAVANNYLKSKYHLLLEQAIPVTHLYNQPVKKFRYIVDSLYVVQKLHLAQFIEKNPSISPEFIKSEKSALRYDRATKLMEYLKSSSYASEVKPDYFNFLNEVNVNDSSLLHLFEFKTFMKAYIEYFATKKLKESNKRNYGPVDYTLAQMQTIVQKIESPAVKNQWLYNALSQHIKFYGYKNTDVLFKVFKLQCTDEYLKMELLEPYKKYMSLSSDKNTDHVQLIDKNGKELNLDNFKGQYIYIDVWATWCLPCRKEAPYFNDLKQKFNHKNIAFISISVDKNKKEWMEYLTVKNMHENQYWVENSDDFLQEFMIKTIPHFILINPDGNIIEPIAPRPSEKNYNWLEVLPDKKAV